VRRVLAEGWSRRQAAEALGVSVRTAHKWIVRFRQEGEAGLLDRSSRPRRCRVRHRGAVVELVIDLRRQHRLSAVQLARAVAVPRATVGRILRRHRLSRWRDLEPPPPPPRRYEHARPGDLLHLDIKKLGKIDGVGHRITGQRQHRARGIGWECAHVAIDDCSRLAYVEILPDETAVTAAAFLDRALAWMKERGITCRRLLTDNGSAYRSALFADLCRRRGLRHGRTRPYRPRTNGKAERFIQTTLREWAYRRAYDSSLLRQQALDPWLHYYNHHRPHSALGGLPPAARVNNVLITDS
jgi:transposase InsO family protein